MLSGTIYTKRKQMYGTYDVLKLLNPSLTLSDFKKFIDHAVATSNYTQFVILDDKTPIAVVAFTDKPLLSAAPKKSLMIQNIAVAKAYQGNQLGVFLLTLINHYAEARDYSSSNTTNLKSNKAAHRMNEKAGFSYKHAELARRYFLFDHSPKTTTTPQKNKPLLSKL